MKIVNTLAMHLLVLIFVSSATVLFAQTPEEQAAGFTLTLSQSKLRYGVPKAFQVLVVSLTNISQRVIGDTTCSAFGAFYNLKVVYNGVPIEEKEEHRIHRKAMEKGPCSGSNPGRRANPGQSLDDILYYETIQPGTYEFTIEREGFPGNPDKSVTVKSNTLTIVVPEPGASAPE
jgi:hypothetical protein